MSSQSDRENEALIKARRNTAGRFGFVVGCCAAVAALSINLLYAPRPWSWVSIVVAVLLAALNVPLGISLGLLTERTTRTVPPSGQR
ncbi:MAG TPA: hypothetical protein VII52_01945 [Gemmatimonadaceae bacterium]